MVALAVATLVAFARSARADPWFGFGENAAEDRFLDGDLDAEDAAHLPSFGRARVGATDLRAKTWVSLLGFAKQFPTGARELGVGVVLGIAFDRIGQGSTHVARDRALPFIAEGSPPSSSPRETPSAASPSQSSSTLSLSGALASGAVRAAWRTAGMDATDARVDEMIARARRSAALPEARLRALRVLNSGENVTYVDSAGHVYETIGANLSLEARLTWRLDRLLYADDEPTIERVRLERQEARARLGTHVLELLFGWQRALLDLATTPAGSRGEMEAVLRRWEAEIALDVLTAGWFGAQGAVKSAGRP